MNNRYLVPMILLYLFTFGIYAIYWHFKFQEELKEKTGEGFGGLGHLLMLLFTFGIYGIYWQYAAGKRLAKQGAEDRSLIYLIFNFTPIAIINPFLMQQQANELK